MKIRFVQEWDFKRELLSGPILLIELVPETEISSGNDILGAAGTDTGETLNRSRYQPKVPTKITKKWNFGHRALLVLTPLKTLNINNQSSQSKSSTQNILWTWLPSFRNNIDRKQNLNSNAVRGLIQGSAYRTKLVLCKSSLMHKTLACYFLSFYQKKGRISTVNI